MVRLEVSLDRYAVLRGVDTEVSASDVGTHLERPSLGGPCEVCGVDVGLVVAFGQGRVGGRMKNEEWRIF